MVYSKEIDKEICDLYLNGVSVSELRRRLHHDHKRISRVLKENGIDVHSKENFEAHHFSKKSAWTYDKCVEAAKECRGRGEFLRKYQSAALNAKKEGWYDSLDQYYKGFVAHYDMKDKIHLIYAYEVTEMHAVYVGRTMNLKARHANHKSKTSRESDSLRDYCNKNGLKVPDPKILEEHLDAEESQVAEDKWVNVYKDNGWYIINRAKTGKGSSSLGAMEAKWTYEACAEAAKECRDKEDYRRKYPTARKVSIQNKWIDDFFDNVRAEKGFYDIYENCLEEARKYNTMSEFKNGYPFVYHKVCSHKWNERICTDLGWKRYTLTKKRKENALHFNTLNTRIEKFIKECKSIDDSGRYDYSGVYEDYKDNRTKVHIYDTVKDCELYRSPSNHIKLLRIAKEKREKNGEKI